MGLSKPQSETNRGLSIRRVFGGTAVCAILFGVYLAVSPWGVKSSEAGEVSRKAISKEAKKESGVLSFKMKTIDGNEKDLSDFKGEVLLIVNTASKCGFTYQYQGMQELYDKYQKKGFRVLAFPANNFMSQEPGGDSEIKEFCETNFGITFDIFSKIDVKGKDIHPLYKYLTEESEHKGKISWNFNKFLVGRDGKIAARYGSKTKPQAADLVKTLEALLREKS